MTTSVTNTSIDPLTGTNASSTTPTGSSTLGQGDFMKLLLAQLNNQDPLNPQDSSAFASQLAQFSSLEQLQQANTSLSNLAVAQASSNQTGDAALVGKQVSFNATGISLSAGSPASVVATFSTAAAKGSMTITDSSGKVIRTIPLLGEPAGQTTLTWDGRDSSGNTAPTGTYQVSFAATDASGQPVSVTQNSSGIVTGVAFNNGTTSLVVNGSQISVSSVTEIDQVPATTTSSATSSSSSTP